MSWGKLYSPGCLPILESLHLSSIEKKDGVMQSEIGGGNDGDGDEQVRER